MIHKLTLVGGPDKDTRSFTLKPGQSLIIGRGRDSHTRIQDPRVSRVHCRLEWEEGRVLLRDEGTTSGTLVNGQRVTRCELIPGAVIQIGDSLLRFDAPALDQPTMPPARPSSHGTSHGTPVASVVPPPLAELVGKSLGSFPVVKILTPTRSGMLFESRDAKTGQRVALKVLAPDLVRLDEQKQRFLRAMKTMLPLRHENLVRILNAGKTGPFCWTAMEYVEGENLKQVIQRLGVDSMLDWREAWRVALHVGQALQFAFQKGFVHRNLTPTNILRRKADRQYLVGDLMLAKAFSPPCDDQLTEPGRFLGEVAYMAPERTYSSSDIDIRSDLYGLGATLYALVTGRPPFTGDSLRDLVRQVRDHLPRPPREFSISMNADFSDLILRLLAKRPDDRLHLPAVLLSELERIGRLTNLRDAG